MPSKKLGVAPNRPHPAGNKRQGVESKSTPPIKRVKLSTNPTPTPNRKKREATFGLGSLGRQEAAPVDAKEVVWRKGEGERKSVWEEVREYEQPVRNLASGDPVGIPDMYLDMSERARLIYSVGQVGENETLGVRRPAPIFKSPVVTIPFEIEHFLTLNARFNLHPREPLDDFTLLEQWGVVEDRALWGFWFRNHPRANYNPEFHVRSDALIPEGIPPEIQQGLDEGAKELLRQAALSRQNWTERPNPRLSAVKLYLKENSLIIKPTDKNLGFSIFPTTEYREAVGRHISTGPYTPLDWKSALSFHKKLLARLPKKGLLPAERKFIRAHRIIQ